MPKIRDTEVTLDNVESALCIARATCLTPCATSVISAAGKALNGALRELRKALELLPQVERDLLNSATVGLEAAVARTKA